MTVPSPCHLPTTRVIMGHDGAPLCLRPPRQAQRFFGPFPDKLDPPFRIDAREA